MALILIVHRTTRAGTFADDGRNTKTKRNNTKNRIKEKGATPFTEVAPHFQKYFLISTQLEAVFSFLCL